MKLKVYISIVLFLAVSVTYSQDNLHIIKYYNSTDSIDVDPYSFFPMQVGNFWQYAFLNEIVREERVTKDSLLNNGSTAIWIMYNNSVVRPIWIIDTSFQVLNWIPDSSYWQGVYFKLNAKLGEEWWVAKFPEDTTRGFIRKVESIFEAEYLGINTTFKEIVEYARDGDNGDYLRHKFLLGAGLGIVQKRNDSMVEPPEYLLSAIIDGDTLGTIVGVDENVETKPTRFLLENNYPNPFNPSTTITYSIPQLPSQSLVKIRLLVYDTLGKVISTLVDENKPSGTYSVNFNAQGLASGVYYYSLISESNVITKPMLLIK